MTRLLSSCSAAVLALGLVACGGENLVLPSEGEPASIAVVQGDGQNGRVGEALPQPLIFEVTDGTGRPVAAATVVVELPGAEVSPDTTATDDNGRAAIGVVLGAEVGTADGSARVLVPEGRTPVETGFSVSAVAASANGLRVVSGADQTALAGEVLPDPLVVEVTDAFGNPIEGVTITWTPEGGGSVSAATATTDAGGVASVVRTLGSTSGLQRTLASSEGLAGSPAVFLHTAAAGTAAGVQIVSGDDQIGAPGTRLAEDLVVSVVDADGNPVVGAAVSWVVTSGGGSLEPATSTTDADGRAATGWVLGPSVGANTAEAVVSGVGRAAFSATAAAGSASQLQIVSGDDQTAPAGEQLPAELVVRATDASGNPVAGVIVEWRVDSGGGSATPESSATDADGRASTRWTLGGTVGDQTLEASVSGAGSVTFGATATVGAASALALGTQPSASASAGVPLERQPVVQLRDAAGNDVAQSGVAVTAAIASGPGTLAGTATRNTDGSGQATFTDLEIGGATGSHTLIFAAPGFTSVTSEGIGVGRAPTTTTITGDDPDPSTTGVAVTVRFEVTSPGGTPSGTVRVTTSGGPESCSAAVGAGSCEITLGSVGDQTLTASYEGNDLFEASSGQTGHTVEAPNAPPVAVDDAYAVAAGGLVTLEVAAPGVLGNDTDPDGDPLRAEVVTEPEGGTLQLAPDGSFQYTPPPLFLGDATFSYRAVDDRGGQSTASVVITVQ
ncbi:MAG TPA: Ig-like domain-containing protein [Gemmatimonadales bacterium]|nr:Ig-like domain-containing protein [Gemmatimonadales bacterium]